MVFHPMAVRATFLMSGFLGLKFGIGGNQKTMEAKVPFNITLENQTIQIPASAIENMSLIASSSSTPLPITTLSTIKNSIRGTRHARTFQLPGFKTVATYDFALHGKCGPGRCEEKEMCVTWVKDGRGRNKGGRESPMMVHQCLQKKGDYHTKVNPSGGGLCANGQIHSILRESQSCLKDEPPCPLVWKYKCVSIADALDSEIHSCRHKTCSTGEHCVEVAECEEEILPCIPVATCK